MFIKLNHMICQWNFITYPSSPATNREARDSEPTGRMKARIEMTTGGT
jgi:hypothetical protein